MHLFLDGSLVLPNSGDRGFYMYDTYDVWCVHIEFECGSTRGQTVRAECSQR
jgi:hypothetical protein